MSSESPIHDLAIGRRLVDGTASVDDVIAFAQWPLVKRAPWLGVVFRWCLDADPAMRGAALSALRGARGVPGVRTLVAGLGDAATRDDARLALVHTARDAPWRWVHALFHADAEVRRAAIPETPHGATAMLAYLRADPACADLVTNARWPEQPLPLAFDLHARARLDDLELVRVIASQPSTDVRSFFEAEHGRTAQDVEAFLEEGGHLRGLDVVDQAFGVAGAGVDADRMRDRIIRALGGHRRRDEAVVTKKPGTLRGAAYHRRATTRPSTMLVGACCALEYACSRGQAAAHAEQRPLSHPLAVAAPAPHVTRLPRCCVWRPALATWSSSSSGSRLKLLVKALGDAAIIEKLLARIAVGTDLPVVSEALELAWLARIETLRIDRYVALASITRSPCTASGLGSSSTRPAPAPSGAFFAMIARDFPSTIRASPPCAHDGEPARSRRARGDLPERR
jgi:hypothetical protein